MIRNRKVIETLLLSAIFIAISICLYILIDDIYPFFSSYIIVLQIIVWVIILSIPVFFICYGIRTNLKIYSKYSACKKIKYSFCFYLLSLLWLLSIEYLCYINNKETFSIDNEYYEHEIKNELDAMNLRLEYNNRYHRRYLQLLSKIENRRQYSYTEKKTNIFLYIQADTLRFILNSDPPRTGGSTGAESEENKYDKYRDVGICFPGEEDRIIREPSSKKILEDLRRGDSIAGIEIANLILDKIKFYKESNIEMRNILENKKKLGLSFSSFITYNILNKGNIANYKSKMISLIVLLQILITTFVSGYIYKQAYKILDGE